MNEWSERGRERGRECNMIENELSSVGHDIISCFLCGLCVGLGKGLVCWCEDST